MANTILTQAITCLAVRTLGRYPASNGDRSIRFNSKIKLNPFVVPEKNLGLIFQNDETKRRNMVVYAGIGDPVDPSSPGSWKLWILGSIFTILLPFITRGKWGPLLQLKEKVETTIDEAQRVVDIIEDVAETVDKVAEETVKNLPPGKLRDAVAFVEKVAENIDKHAERAEDALEQVENMGDQLESIMESTTEQENTVTTTTEAAVEKNTIITEAAVPIKTTTTEAAVQKIMTAKEAAVQRCNLFVYIKMANTTFTRRCTCLAMETLCQASKVDNSFSVNNFRFNSKVKYNCFSVPEQNLGLRFRKDITKRMNMAVYASIQSGNSPPVDSSPGHWKLWIIGTIVTIFLSFTKSKWGPLLILKEKIETTIDEAESVANIVEEVADGVEKVAEEAAKHLPKGKLRDAAEFVENVAENVEKQAQNAEDLLEQVEDTENEVDSFFESTTHEEKRNVAATDSEDKK
ncbi:hypothetical protein VNO78_31056 [Psophocarpus tetragonolobus]|uniref:Uncharacterized protein n=1 Tax=Psophocarpus tetragonolobus TaxID=3891 RepID=A0AAN9RY98_PSOTE